MGAAGITLFSDDVSLGPIGSSNTLSATLEELQYTLGEGPGVDAYEQGQPVSEPDIARPARWRWPAFSVSAVEAGIRAVIAVPLDVGPVSLGALTLYRDRPGPFSERQLAVAMVIAREVAEALRAIQASEPPESLGAHFERALARRVVLYQASGMVAVQVHGKVTDALVRLRAYAFANDCNLDDVASDVVGRRLGFDRLGAPVVDTRTQHADQNERSKWAWRQL